MSRLNDNFGRGLVDFDPNFDKGLRTVKRAGAGIGCLAIVWVLFGLALTCGVVYVAIHFIAKVW